MPADALEDLTGGLAESINLSQKKYKENEEKKKLHQELKKCAEKQFLISASIGVSHPKSKFSMFLGPSQNY